MCLSARESARARELIRESVSSTCVQSIPKNIHGKLKRENRKKYHLIDVVTASGLAVTLADVEEEACVGPLSLRVCVCVI